MPKYWCNICNQRILKKELPWCDKCREHKLYVTQKVEKKINSKKKMNYKLQDENAPEGDEVKEPETPETPKEGEKESSTEGE